MFEEEKKKKMLKTHKLKGFDLCEKKHKKLK